MLDVGEVEGNNRPPLLPNMTRKNIFFLPYGTNVPSKIILSMAIYLVFEFMAGPLL